MTRQVFSMKVLILLISISISIIKTNAIADTYIDPTELGRIWEIDNRLRKLQVLNFYIDESIKSTKKETISEINADIIGSANFPTSTGDVQGDFIGTQWTFVSDKAFMILDGLMLKESDTGESHRYYDHILGLSNIVADISYSYGVYRRCSPSVSSDKAYFIVDECNYDTELFFTLRSSYFTLSTFTNEDALSTSVIKVRSSAYGFDHIGEISRLAENTTYGFKNTTMYSYQVSKDIKDEISLIVGYKYFTEDDISDVFKIGIEHKKYKLYVHNYIGYDSLRKEGYGYLIEYNGMKNTDYTYGIRMNADYMSGVTYYDNPILYIKAKYNF